MRQHGIEQRIVAESRVAEAQRRGTGIAAFNVITLEHAEAIAAGAEEAGLPAILQISENAVRFHGGRLGPVALAAAEVARGYCAAVRSAITDDGRPPLAASGLRLKARLEAVADSLDRVKEKGAARRRSRSCAN